DPAGASSLNWLPSATAAAPSALWLLTTTVQSPELICDDSGYGFSRVPCSAAASAGSAPSSATTASPSVGCVTLVSVSPKASSNASSTMVAIVAKKTMNPTIVPTTESTRPTTPIHLRLPLRNSDTIESTNAIGSSTQPTISAPGMHANRNPTPAVIRAISASTFIFCFAGAAGPASGTGYCGAVTVGC